MSLSFPVGLEPVDDLTPATWVREALAEWPSGPFKVSDLIPPVFDAYARVLHRPHRPTDRETPGGSQTLTASVPISGGAEMIQRLIGEQVFESFEVQAGDLAVM
jgi:hypothetical protein